MRIEITDHFLKRWGQRVGGCFSKKIAQDAVNYGHVIMNRKYVSFVTFFENEMLYAEKRILYAGFCWCIIKRNQRIIFTTIYPQWKIFWDE